MAFRNIKKVLISDKVDSSCESTLRSSGFEVVYKPGMKADELLKEVETIDALIVRSATKVTADVMRAAKQLKLIGRAGTGVDNIDVKFATQQGIIVMNTPGGNTLSAAEHTCALIASMARLIPQAYNSITSDKWERSKFMGVELNGKTLGIVGLGRIGKEVALRMQSYGMKTVGFDPIVSKEDAAEWNIEYLQLEDLWPVADFITVHTPLIPQTKGLLRNETFSKCKKGVRVVNVARGGIIDEDDLLAALESGQCAGAALDVFVSEPPKETSLKLVHHPNVVATPHLGASTTEAQLRVAREIAEQIADLVKGTRVFGALNAPALELAAQPGMCPWIELADKLGQVTKACLPGVKGDVQITTCGDILSKAGRVVSTAVAMGIVKKDHGNSNIVNASALAEEQGIKVTAKSIGGCDASICVHGNSDFSLSGKVFGSQAYLTEVSGKHLGCPVPLDGHLLVCIDKKVPTADAVASLASVASLSSIGLGDHVVVASCKLPCDLGSKGFASISL